MPRPDVIPTSVQLGPRAMAFHEFLAAAARARRGRPARVSLFLGEWPGAPAPSTRPAQRPRNARADGPVRGARKDAAAWENSKALRRFDIARITPSGT